MKIANTHLRTFKQHLSLVYSENGSIYKIAVIYSPPKYKIKTKDYLTFFGSLRDRRIVDGNLNDKHHMWNSRLITTKATALYNANNAVRASCFSNGEPMYWPTEL